MVGTRQRIVQRMTLVCIVCLVVPANRSPCAEPEASVANPPTAATVTVPVDPLAEYRERAERAVAQKDALAAEKLLREMPDVDLMVAVRNNDLQLLQLVELGNPDSFRVSLESNYNYFEAAIKHDNPELFRLLLRHNETISPYKLIWAARSGCLPLAKLMIEQGADIDEVDDSSGTPLHQAISQQHDEIVTYLLELGTKINLTNEYGWTPLHAAAYRGRIDYAEQLLARGADPAARMRSGFTPVHQAISSQQFDFARWLLQHGGTMDAHVAAGLGDLETVRKLWPDPLQLDKSLPDWPSPVFMAASSNEVEVVKYFIEAGLDVNLSDYYQRTLLLEAAAAGATDVVKYLLSQRADPLRHPAHNISAERYSPLHAAAHAGHLATVRVLLDHGMAVDLPNQWGETALVVASKEGHLDLMRLLIERGAKLDGLGRGATPLGAAIDANLFAAFQLLLEAGANPNGAENHPANGSKSMPLAHVVNMSKQEDSTRYFDLLLKFGAKLNVPPEPGDDRRLDFGDRGRELELRPAVRSVLVRCVSRGNPALIQRLIDLGADVNERDRSGESVLMLALEHQSPAVARMLLAAGAKFAARDNEHVAYYVGRLGDVEVMKSLIEQQGGELSKNVHGVTGIQSALSGALQLHRKDLVRFLLSQGANAKHMGNYSNPPLLAIAAKEGDKLIMLDLIDAGGGEPIGEPGLSVPLLPQSLAIEAAIDGGRPDTLRSLLQRGAWIKEEHRRNLFLDMLTSDSADHVKVLEVLKEYVKPADMPDINMPVHAVVAYGNVNYLRPMLELGADLQGKGLDENTLLHDLARRRPDRGAESPEQQVAIAKLLLEHGIRPESKDNHGYTAAHAAIVAHKPELAKFLVEQGAPLDSHLAAALGNVGYLKQRYAELQNRLPREELSLVNIAPLGVDAADPLDGVAPAKPKKLHPARGLLAWAAAGGSVESIQWLTSLKQLDPNGGDNLAPLLVAIEYKHLPVVKALLAAGANPNGNEHGLISLPLVAQWGDLEAVRLLLQHEVDVRQTNVRGANALHVAVNSHKLPLVEMLVQAGVPLNETVQGSTPLELAASRDYRPAREIALYLLEAGADPKAGRGEVLYWEVEHGEYARVEAFLKAGLNPNKQTATGNLPLAAAVTRYGQSYRDDPAGHRLIQLLLDHGADPNVPDANLKTPLAWSQGSNYDEGTRLMRAAIAKRAKRN